MAALTTLLIILFRVRSRASPVLFRRLKVGASRAVFLTRSYAIKIPTWRAGWRGFLTGLLGNHQERLWGRRGLPGLCPVLLADPLGFFVVMPRLQILGRELSSQEFEDFRRRDGYVVPAENKADSLGWYQGQLVAVDYGN